MNEVVLAAGSCCDLLAAGLWRATWQAAVLIPLVWLAERLLPRIPPMARSWLWRGVYLKLLIALVVPGAIGLPLLPPPARPSQPPISSGLIAPARPLIEQATLASEVAVNCACSVDTSARVNAVPGMAPPRSDEYAVVAPAACWPRPALVAFASQPPVSST